MHARICRPGLFHGLDGVTGTAALWLLALADMGAGSAAACTNRNAEGPWGLIGRSLQGADGARRSWGGASRRPAGGAHLARRRRFHGGGGGGSAGGGLSGPGPAGLGVGGTGCG